MVKLKSLSLENCSEFTNENVDNKYIQFEQQMVPRIQYENVHIIHMVEHTLKRLKTTCYGFCDDGVGECFDTSIVVLRFLAVVCPTDIFWIQSRIENYNNHFDEKKRPRFAKWYFWLCLSELLLGIVGTETEKYKDEILKSGNQHLFCQFT